MDAIFQMTHSNAYFFNKDVTISIKISLKFVGKGLVNNEVAFFHIMRAVYKELLKTSIYEMWLEFHL